MGDILNYNRWTRLRLKAELWKHRSLVQEVGDRLDWHADGLDELLGWSGATGILKRLYQLWFDETMFNPANTDGPATDEGLHPVEFGRASDWYWCELAVHARCERCGAVERVEAYCPEGIAGELNRMGWWMERNGLVCPKCAAADLAEAEKRWRDEPERVNA